MDELQIKASAILKELTDQIMDFAHQGQFTAAHLLMDQYIKLSPHSIDRYSVEAMLGVLEGNLEYSEKILHEGLGIYPQSFDLLYNLGYVYEQMEDILEAYHMYMKARYIASTEQEKSDIALALDNIKDEFSGEQITKDDKTLTILNAGNIQLTLTVVEEELLKQKKLLSVLEKYIDRNSQSVLEIGFTDGTIGKNLNYYGYDVTAVDRLKENILQVIAKEWQDNLSYPKQKVAKFYHDQVNIEWIKRIPEFDVIMVIEDNGLDNLGIGEEEKQEALNLLLKKTKNQLFMRVASNSMQKEMTKEDLLKVSKGYNLKLVSEKDEDGFEIYAVDKRDNIEAFGIPTPATITNSKSTILEVDICKCVDIYGASYTDDFHQFVELLKEHEANSGLRYKDSILNKYYNHFQPINLEHALFSTKEEVPFLRQGFIGYPWYWNKDMRLVFSKEREDTRPGGNHHFGPNTDEFGNNELERLVSLYTYLEKHDYHPEMFADGYISGYLLVKHNDYRFVVTEGQHRIACLAALGYEKISCRFTQRDLYPKIVDYKDIKKWPQVENKVYSRNQARKVFNRFFDDGVGRDRMGD